MTPDQLAAGNGVAAELSRIRDALDQVRYAFARGEPIPVEFALMALIGAVGYTRARVILQETATLRIGELEKQLATI